MRVLDQMHDVMKIDQINNSEHSPNIFPLFFLNFYMGPILDIKQYLLIY